MSALDNVTVMWLLITLSVAVVAFALGFLLGQADGLELRLRRTLRLARRRR